MFEDLLTTQALVSLLTLSFLEIVLGIDNIIFISIVSDRLPKNQQGKARTIGLALALIMRIALLMGIAWMVSATKPLFTVLEHEVSIRDIILIGGGIFLLAKSTTEIHSKVEGSEEELKAGKALTLGSAIVQIVLLDMVFSFDSILTAIGLTKQIPIMVAAVIIAMIIMLVFAKTVSDFVNRNPTVKVLALAFLLMIGVLLILDGFGVHVPKGYIYFSIAFSLFVEMLNLRMRKRRKRLEEEEA
jgi:predicted tellurium resistance membrane protein TerC